jgi:hypothetical protein
MWKYKITYTFTRKNTTVLWEDPNSEYDFIYQLGESFSRNILVDEKLSDEIPNDILYVETPNDDKFNVKSNDKSIEIIYDNNKS